MLDQIIAGLSALSLGVSGLLGIQAAEVSAPNTTNVVVTPGDLQTDKVEAYQNGGWFIYNDVNDQIENSLATFVEGPENPPLGSDSVEISVEGSERVNLATYQFSGTLLSEITTLSYSTYNASAGNGGSANRSGYLHFNVDFDGTDNWQRRLVYLPSDNGTVNQDEWQEWDTIADGDALWRYSGSTWPGTLIPGTTPRTWNEILDEYEGVRVRVTDSFMGIRVGEPYANGYTENLDAFKFGVNDKLIVFDFEQVRSPLSKDECKNGGYIYFVDADGSTFRNQGQCVSYVARMQ